MTLQRFILDNSEPTFSWHLLEEINHRVINEYAHATALLALAEKRLESMEARDALATAAHRLRAFAETHRSLLPPLGTGSVNLCDYVGRYCSAALKSSLADTGVKIALHADDIDLPASRCWRVGLIVAELISNAFRHGLGGGAGSIAISLRDQPDMLCCEVADNGKGATEPALGRGLRVVCSIAAELGGSVDWSFTPNGTTARLRVPSS